ncbi:MAG: hypothetical protein JNJ55_11290 [Betaproteobacteria bacterium]|nr:hypothetical protein [Betaproteobacteria bacterium]
MKSIKIPTTLRAARRIALWMTIAAFSAGSTASISDLDLPEPEDMPSGPSTGAAPAATCSRDEFLTSMFWGTAESEWLIGSLQRNDPHIAIHGHTSTLAAVPALLKALKKRGYRDVNLARLESPTAPKGARYQFWIELRRDCAG